MKNKILKLIIVLNLSLSGVFAADFLPSNIPLASQQPPKPNILMVLDSSGSMKAWDMTLPAGYENDTDPIKNVTRIVALRAVVKKQLESYYKNAFIGFTKLGYTSPYEYYYGKDRDISILKHPVADLTLGTALNDAKNMVNSIPDDGGTPLAFSIYEAAKHLRGESMLKMVKGNGTNIYTNDLPSPVRYRCQQQHMIMLTDGGANMDGVYAKLPSDTLIAEREINLALVAKQLWNIDLRDAKNKTLGGTSDSHDAAGKAWKSVGSIKLPLYIHAIRFGTNPDAVVGDPALQAMVDQSGSDPITKNKNGVFEKADNAAKLDEAFYKIFQAIIATRSGAESLQDQEQLSKNTVKYSNSYNPSSWTGEIKANKYNSATGKFDIPLWSTSGKDGIKYNQGSFFTTENSGATVDLTADNLGLKQKNAKAMVNWLKGGLGGNLLRVRDTPLGDIVGSHPVYSAKDVLNINLSSLGTSVRADFIKYLYRKNNSDLKNLIIAGSNDGLINFIVADKNASGAGTRFVSYFPNFLKNQIEKITTSNYTHLFQINGETNLFDAKVGSDYKTIGITSLAAGGAALVGYTLYSDSGSTNFKVNFEITKDTGNFKNLGYTYSGVEFYNRQHENDKSQAVAVFGNGFGGKDGVSSVYFIDAVTGKVINEIELGNTGGAATPAIVVKTGAGGFQQIDRLYVGDFSGNLHRITFDSNDYNKTKTTSTTILFKAGGEKYPISVRPALVMDKSKKPWVYFGTGRAADESRDKGLESKVIHNFYGIKDNDEEELVELKDLVEQNITSSKEDGKTVLMTTSNVTGNAEFGWYIPLKSSGEGDPRGERVVKPAAVYNNGYIHFVSWGISEGDEGDPCDPDDIFGKSFVLKLFSGNSSNLKNTGVSGTAMEDDAPGLLVAPRMEKQNLLGGNGRSNQLTAQEKKGEGPNEGLKNAGLSDSSHVNSGDVKVATEGAQGYEKGGGGPGGLPPGNEAKKSERIYFNRIF